MVGEMFDDVIDDEIDEKLEDYVYEGFENEFDDYEFTKEDIEKLDIEVKREILESLEKADITNDYIFSRLMRFKNVCKEILELLIGLAVDEIIYIGYQEVIENNFKTKGIRLDILVRDKNRIYNIEMQVANDTEIAKRIRIYQGVIDASETIKGVSYEDIKPTYIIFICKKDPIGDGEYAYEAEMCVRKMGANVTKSKSFNNGAKVYIFNASSNKRPADKKLTAFLDLVAGKTIQHEFTDMLKTKIYKIKQNKEMRLGYMQLNYRDRKNVEKGIEKGRNLRDIEIICNMLDDFTIEEIAKSLKLPIEKIEELKEEYLFGNQN